MAIKTYKILADVKATTPSGKIEDLTPHIANMSVQKDLTDLSGRWSVNLLPLRDNLGVSFYYRIQPQSYIDIRFGRFAKSKGDLRPIMRGFCDAVSTQVSTDGSVGKPLRSYIIRGQDYGKLFKISIIIYYLVKGAVEKAILPNKTNYVYDLPLFGKPQDVIGSILDNVVRPQLASIKETYCDIPDLGYLYCQDILGEIGNLAVNSYQGNMEDLIRTYMGEPWHELFISELEKPTLIYRKTPWISDGQYVQDGIDINASPYQETLGGPIMIAPGDIVDFSLTRTDSEVSNYFFTYPMHSIYRDASAFKMSAVASDPKMEQNPILIDPADEFAGENLFGKRPFEYKTPILFLSPEDAPEQYKQSQDTAVNFCGILNSYLTKAFGKNSALESGSFVLKGNENITPGRYLQFGGGEDASLHYITSVTHSLSFLNRQESFLTTVQTVRGTWFLNTNKRLRSVADKTDFEAIRKISGRF